MKDRPSLLRTNCFETVSGSAAQSSYLQHDFMIASQGGISKLWNLYAVQASIVPPETQPSYDITAAAKDIETFEVLDALAAFENQKTHDGHTTVTDFTYKDAAHFKDAALSFGYIFDLDNMRPGIVDENGIPQAAGRYAPEVLQKLAQSAPIKDPHAAERVLDHAAPTQPVDFGKLSEVMDTKQRITDFTRALKACLLYLDGMSKYKSAAVGGSDYRRYAEYDVVDKPRYEHICTHNLYKSFQKAIKGARAAVKAMPLKEEPEIKRTLEEYIMAFEFYLDILDAQTDYEDCIKKGKTKKAANFRNRAEKLRSKYKGKITDETLASMDHVIINFQDISVPRVLHEITHAAAQYEHEINAHARQIQNDAAQNGRTDYDLKSSLASGPRMR